MSSSKYAIRLAVVVFVFAIAIPGLVIGSFYLLQLGGPNVMFGSGLIAFFFGIPVWVIAFGIALWRTSRERLQVVGLPEALGWALMLLVGADAKFFLWIFRPFQAPFLLGAIMLLIALIFWPDRGPREKSEDDSIGGAKMIAIGSFFILVFLAGISLIGWLTNVVTLSRGAFLLEYNAKWFASWWIFVVGATMTWAVIDARQRRALR